MDREDISRKIQSNQVAKESTREWIENLVDEIYDHFEAENKKLKKKLREAQDLRNDSVLIGQDDVEFLIAENKRYELDFEALEAKLADIESKKVAEFSGEAGANIAFVHIKGDGWHQATFEHGGSIDIELGETYKITISKQ